jgi:hypothetical protein
MSHIYEYKTTNKLPALLEVVRNEFLELGFTGFGNSSISITGQIDQVPGLIDQKVIDQLGFSWPAGRFGKTLTVGQHIDQGRLSHVGPAYKGIFWEFTFGTFFDVLIGHHKFCTGNIHAAKIKDEGEETESFVFFSFLKGDMLKRKELLAQVVIDLIKAGVEKKELQSSFLEPTVE